MMDLHWVQENDHNSNLYYKNQPKWDAADPKQSITNIREYFESLPGTNKTPCSYMLHPDIVPLDHKNQALRLWNNPNKMMIKQCPIIPIKQHRIYFGRTNT